MTNKRVAIVVLASMLQVCTLLAVGKPCFSNAQTDNCLIGAYDYIWCGMGVNNHWIMDDTKGTPFMGTYNSSDPTVADRQILLAMQHGIDFFPVSWAGKGNWLDWDFDDIDYNFRNGFLKASHLEDFNFCLFYETVLVMENAINLGKNFTQIFIEDMNYALKYLNHTSYLRFNDDPVLFIYNLPYLYAHAQNQSMTFEDVHRLFDYIRERLGTEGVTLYIIGDVGNGPSPTTADSHWFYSLNATTSYHFSDEIENWDEVLQNVETFYPQWLSEMTSRGIGFVPNVYPGSNNTNNTGTTPKDWTALPRNVTAFKQMLQIALKTNSNPPGIVMITSWNEWMEATNIEPSIEEGEVFLHTIYDCVHPREQAIETPIWPLLGSAVLGVIITAGSFSFFFFRSKGNRKKTEL